jgi:hypothetical protein
MLLQALAIILRRFSVVTFDSLKAVLTNINILLNNEPLRQVKSHRHFEEVYRLLLQYHTVQVDKA